MSKLNLLGFVLFFSTGITASATDKPEGPPPLPSKRAQLVCQETLIGPALNHERLTTQVLKALIGQHPEMFQLVLTMRVQDAVRLAADQDRVNRILAIWSIRARVKKYTMLAADHPRVFPMLRRRALRDTDPAVREAALRTLGDLHAYGVMPHIWAKSLRQVVESMSDDQDGVRLGVIALNALARNLFTMSGGALEPEIDTWLDAIAKLHRTETIRGEAAQLMEWRKQKRIDGRRARTNPYFMLYRGDIFSDDAYASLLP